MVQNKPLRGLHHIRNPGLMSVVVGLPGVCDHWHRNDVWSCPQFRNPLHSQAQVKDMQDHLTKSGADSIQACCLHDLCLFTSLTVRWMWGWVGCEMGFALLFVVVRLDGVGRVQVPILEHQKRKKAAGGGLMRALNWWGFLRPVLKSIEKQI